MNEYRLKITYVDGGSETVWVEAQDELSAAMMFGMLLGEDFLKTFKGHVQSVTAVIETN